MNNKIYGGAAFPQSGYAHWAPEGGMTLRDYFAAKAMQSMVSAEYSDRLDSATWCQHAYQMADAMLEARNK